MGLGREKRVMTEPGSIKTGKNKSKNTARKLRATQSGGGEKEENRLEH